MSKNPNVTNEQWLYLIVRFKRQNDNKNHCLSIFKNCIIKNLNNNLNMNISGLPNMVIYKTD